MKICGHCKIEKPKDSFCKDKTTKDGLSKWCGICRSDANKKARIKAKQKARRSILNKAYRENNKEDIERKRSENKGLAKEYREANRNKRKTQKSRSPESRNKAYLKKKEEMFNSIINK